MDTAEMILTKETARHLGATRETVMDWVNKGCPHRVGGKTRIYLDPDAVWEWRVADRHNLLRRKYDTTTPEDDAKVTSRYDYVATYILSPAGIHGAKYDVLRLDIPDQDRAAMVRARLIDAVTPRAQTKHLEPEGYVRAYLRTEWGESRGWEIPPLPEDIEAIRTKWVRVLEWYEAQADTSSTDQLLSQHRFR